MTTRNYSSNYKVKEFLINEIAPKFLDLDDVNQLNVGLLGYTTEMQSVATEDVFNAMNILLKETHASRATMLDTIYTNASIYSVDNIMGKPASLRALLFIKEDDIIEKGVPSGDRYMFTFDSNAKFRIGGIYFALDYDIIVTARPYRGDYQFLAQYDMSYKNSMSNVVHPYINAHRMKIESDNYIALDVYIRQYERVVVEENIINNDRINLPVLTAEYSNQLAGIDVYYRDPGDENYILLEQRMEGTVPSTKPFYFYSIKDNGKIEISFTGREKYFQPKYNSDVKIVLYTTIGSKGNFKEYTGTDIQIINDNPKFDHMRQLIPFLTVVGPSVDGTDALSKEDVRTLTVENMAVSGSYNTEDDINLFFKNYTNINNLFITFIKKRDDLVERLFSGFMMFKDKYGDFFHTNTLNLDLFQGLFDFESESLDKYIIRPGRIFKYFGNSLTNVRIEPQDVRSTNVDVNSEEFLYTNPFLMVYQKKPNSLGYYINSVNSIHALDFEYADIESPIQFIANSLKVERNAIIGEDSYKLSLKLKPTKKIEKDPATGALETDGALKVLLSFEESDGSHSKAVLMEQVDYDEVDELFTFKAELKTDDLITSNHKISLRDLYDLDTGSFGEQNVKMVNAILNVNVMFDYGKKNNSHPFKMVGDMDSFTVVNRYSTETNKVSLVTPINFIRSRTLYDRYVKDVLDGEEIMDYYLKIYQVPLVAAHHITNEETLIEFMEEILSSYKFLQEISKMKTSNFNIDLKFYNTYGRAINFAVGDEGSRLDKTNISIYIKIQPTVGTIVNNLFSDVREYIKQYIENVNENKSQNIGVMGYNAIYISNLIQELENNFPGILYMKFTRINDYDSSVQVIENNTVDVETMTLRERRDYIPEFLTIRLEDIHIDLIYR